MARIPEAELERLKREVGLEGLVRVHGMELKTRGEDLVATCPLRTHDDTTPAGACRGGRSEGAHSRETPNETEESR